MIDTKKKKFNIKPFVIIGVIWIFILTMSNYYHFKDPAPENPCDCIPTTALVSSMKEAFNNGVTYCGQITSRYVKKCFIIVTRTREKPTDEYVSHFSKAIRHKDLTTNSVSTMAVLVNDTFYSEYDRYDRYSTENGYWFWLVCDTDYLPEELKNYMRDEK